MDPICPLVVELPIGVSVALLQSIVGAHAQVIGTTLVCTSGKWSDALGKCTALPSVVDVAPGTLLPVPHFSQFGSRFAYRRFGKAGGVPLVFNQHFTGMMDHWDPAVTDCFAKDR